ncbi:MAG: response regulator [Candidatus Korobacteraceae bacterium]|jgi:two-component system chemotaxis sensor kinase CheA
MAQDPYRYFRIEARELVEQLSRGVLELERGAAGKELVARLLRLAHTLKGAAHVVKQAEIASLSHQMEDVLVPHAAGNAIPKAATEAMLRLLDNVAAQLAKLGSGPVQPEAGGAAQGESQLSPPAAPAAEELFDTVRVDLEQMDRLLEGIAETGVQLAGLAAKLAAIERTADMSALLVSQLEPRAFNGGNGRGAVSAGKARAIAEDLQSSLRPLRRDLALGAEQVERELVQVRDIASRLRLVPASAVFEPLRRTARNAAQAQAKQVEFETTGGEHRLDAHVLAAVRDALVQVVRNAVAHGIETPPERAAAGKAAAGKVSLEVQRHGNRVTFACHDDGRGFNVEALRRAALERALLSAEAAEALNAEDVFRLLLRGGLSTSGTVTEVSGRGIGLDVVRNTALKLKAEVVMRTYAGRGSTVEISVPVSLLSLGAILVESGGVNACLPLDAVKETLRLSEDEIAHNADGDSIIFEGRGIPFLPLASALGKAAARQRGRKSAVVIRGGAEVAALGVDRLLGTATILLRSIPAFAAVDPIVAGAALDAEGNPLLVLDPAELVVAAGRRATGKTEAEPRPPVVLVIDDSLTTRMLEQSILESAGYEVHLAVSGEEALAKARNQRYDLFVVDIEMPGMDGFEFIARARSDAELSGVPAILVTSRSSAQDKLRGEQAGARAYVVKSEFDQKYLLETISQLVGQE